MKYSQLISLSLFIFCGILLLCTVFMTDPSLVDGFVTGKIHWFHQTMLFFSVCSIFYNYILNCQPSLVNYYLGYPFNASNINPDSSSASSGLSLMHCLAASRPCPSFVSL